MIYASAQDLPEDLQDLEDLDRRLSAASNIVTWLVGNDYYPTDEDGMPTGHLREVFKEATVTQLIFTDQKYGGVDVSEEDAPAQLGSLKFGSNSNSGRNENYGTSIRQNVSPTVWYLLRNNGLIQGRVRS